MLTHMEYGSHGGRGRGSRGGREVVVVGVEVGGGTVVNVRKTLFIVSFFYLLFFIFYSCFIFCIV